MYADREDMPYHLQHKTGSSAVRWIVAVIAASGITLGALYIGSQSMGKNHSAAVSEKLAKEATRRHQIAEQQRAQQAINARNEAQKEELRNWWKKDEAHWQRSTAESQAALREREAQDSIAWTKDAPEDQARQERDTRLSRQTSFHDGNYAPQGATNIIPAVQTYNEPYVTQKQQKTEVTVVGKREKRLSDYCRGREGSIELRNCRTMIDLETRNQGLSR